MLVCFCWIGNEGERTELLDPLIVNIQTHTLQHACYVVSTLGVEPRNDAIEPLMSLAEGEVFPPKLRSM